MKKIRFSLAIIALIATLSGLPIQGLGVMANAVSSRHISAVSSSHVVGKSVRSIVGIRKPPCGSGNGYDC